MWHSCLTNPVGALDAIRTDNVMLKCEALAVCVCVTCSRTVRNISCVNSIQTYSSIKVIRRLGRGETGGHNHQKATSVWIFCSNGRKLANESQWLAITAAVVTCQNLPCTSWREAGCGTPSPGAALRCAVLLCWEAVIDSPGNSFFIKNPHLNWCLV